MGEKQRRVKPKLEKVTHEEWLTACNNYLTYYHAHWHGVGLDDSLFFATVIPKSGMVLPSIAKRIKMWASPHHLALFKARLIKLNDKKKK